MPCRRILLKQVGIAVTLVAVTFTGGGWKASAAGTTYEPATPSSTSTTETRSGTGVTVTGLVERPELVDACRFSPRGNLEVFADAALTRRLFTLTSASTPVYLTGVVGTGIAQIKDPALGWIRTANVELCSAPPTTPPPVSEQICYRVIVDRLPVRTGPGNQFTLLGTYRQGGTVFATTNPPREQTTSDGRIWTEINAPNGTGWLARTGANGVGQTIVQLPSDECND